MGVLDKFLDILKLSDEDEDYDEDFFYGDGEDFDDDEVEDTPKKNFFRKEKKYEEEETEEDNTYQFEKKSRNSRTVNNSKVTPMRQSSKRSPMEVCVIKPSVLDDSQTIIETLLSGRTVILNMEGLDFETTQRITDVASGATFALNARLSPISKCIFLITPTSVDVSGDLNDLLTNSFDMPAIKTKY